MIGTFTVASLKSFSTDLFIEPLQKNVSVDFIRAPRIQSLSPNVQILAKFNDLPVLFQYQRSLASTFHIETSGDPSLHEYFLSI